MHVIINKILSLFRIFSPAFLLVLLTSGYSYLGVFIDEEPLLMLRGGYYNFYVFFFFYILSNILSWIIAFYMFKFSKLFNNKFKYILIPFISISSLVISLCIYYFVMFYLLTGLLITDISFNFSINIKTQLIQLLILLVTSAVLIGFIANITFILINRKSPKIKGSSPKDNKDTDNLDSSTVTSSFEDSIAI